MRLFFLIICVAFYFGYKIQGPQEQGIEEYLVSHPDFIFKVIEKYPTEIIEALNKASKKHVIVSREKMFKEKVYGFSNYLKFNPGAREVVPFNPARSYLGDSKANNTIVVFCDFFCAHCAKGAKLISQMASVRNDLRVQFRHFSSSPASKNISAIFEAVVFENGQAKALQLAEFVFGHQKKIYEDQELLRKFIVSDLGLDFDHLLDVASSKEISERLHDDANYIEKVGGKGTPLYLVNGMMLSGLHPLKNLEFVLEQTQLED